MKEKIKDLEIIIDNQAANARHNKQYVELRAKLEAYEDAIDIAEGMKED